MIKDVILFCNGMVMVFDEHGQQMTQYQGTRIEAAKKLEFAYLTQAKFSMGLVSKTFGCSAQSFFFACKLP